MTYIQFRLIFWAYFPQTKLIYLSWRNLHFQTFSALEQFIAETLKEKEKIKEKC